MVPAGLERALAPFGIALDEDLVVEEDAELAFPNAGGIRFVTLPRSHTTTSTLVRTDEKKDVPRTIVHFARSLHKVTEQGSATPTDLLATSPKAFGLMSIAGAAEWKDAPKKRPGDLGGPLVVAMAAERPKVSPSAPHGPRVVVVGTASVLTSPTFREPLPLRGAALFVENSMSWLAAKPQVLDIPDRPAVAAGIRITDDDRSKVQRYVVFIMPGSVALLGVVIAVWRRRTEGEQSENGERKAERKKETKDA